MSKFKLPTIKTQRLILTPISKEHSQGMFELWSNENVVKYSGNVTDYDGNTIKMPVSKNAESDRIIEFWLKAYLDGWGFRWAIIFIEKNKFAGTIGFNSLSKCYEIAYYLLPKFWGQGIMTEASQAAIKWASNNGAKEIEAFCEPQNKSSISLATGLGMTPTEDYSEGARRYKMNL